MPQPFHKALMYSLPGDPMSAPPTGNDRTYVGMREVTTPHALEDEAAAQEALQDHLPVQPAIDGRGRKKADRTKWIAAAVVLALLLAALAVLLATNAADAWR